MHVPIDEITDVVAMGNGFVTASRSVNMGFVVPGTDVIRRAPHRVCRADLDDMLVDVSFVHMVQVPVVEVVDVVTMAHGCVAACWTVDVGVVRMFGLSALAHGLSPGVPAGHDSSACYEP